MSKKHKYGRGKFETHPNYIEYMKWIVEHDSYQGLQNAKSEDGRINWQVSSGKTTSFYKDYLARFEWWVQKADSLGLEGTRNSNDRFSITARIIHPTKERSCRLCGEKRNVGYFYLNKNFAKKLNKITETEFFTELQSLNEVVSIFCENSIPLKLLIDLFPEKNISENSKPEQILSIFKETIHIRSRLLSPGYMCNPPDRLDGFHDYCVFCRKKNDPGRSDENMQKYNRDRRAFEWWVTGNWKAADTLYNLAGSGECEFCGKKVKKLSPDHVGPLACGFKHEVLFRPLCSPCNSSRNRKMSLNDFNVLDHFEKEKGFLLSSPHIESFWIESKKIVDNDSKAEFAATIMRSIQDYYLRLLYLIKNTGGAYFLTPIIGHRLAHYEYEFVGIDRSKFTFKELKEVKSETNGSRSLERRVIRIAFDELEEYAKSPLDRRKVKKLETEELLEIEAKIKTLIKEKSKLSNAKKWSSAISFSDLEKREGEIGKLIESESYQSEKQSFDALFSLLKNYYELLGKKGISLLQDAK